LFATYRPLEGCFDECVLPDGTVRPHWQTLVDGLDAIGGGPLQQRATDARRQTLEAGMTFYSFGQEEERQRPWELGVVPLMIAADEWDPLSDALGQRARLLEAILDDLLGPQRLIRERVVPPELLFGSSDFFRSYHGLKKPAGGRLQTYAADLARDRQGRWWVTGDRTRCPSGLGYLLENRILISRLHPHLYRQGHIRRLATFYAKLRSSMGQLSPTAGDNPRVVLLSPGEASYRHFEDSYLARYLGLTLAEGRDLAVRQGRVMLKTLGGLLPVDVLRRHLSDEDSDPLELNPKSSHGVSGLLNVLRAGNVAVTNGLGTRIVQAPAFAAFLPAISRFLFQEELRLPSAASWWCGQPQAYRYVREHLDQLIIRPAFRVTGAAPLEPAKLSAAAKQDLLQQIKAAPYRYVAQEPIQRSTAPALVDGQLVPRHMALRCFLASQGGEYHALPGGLVRVAADCALLDRTMSAGQSSQDCWVVAAGPIDQVTLLEAPGTPMELRRGGAELPSRVADHLFWLGRYSERAEMLARLMRTTLQRLAGESERAALPEIPTLLRSLATLGQIEPDYVVEGLRQRLPDVEAILPPSLFSDREPHGLRQSVSGMLRNASAVRDRISLDSWRIVQQIDSELHRETLSPDGLDLSQSSERLSRIITGLLALSGLAHESASQSLGWRFWQIGRRLERATQTVALLQATLIERQPKESPVLEALLDATDSLMTYRSRYLSRMQAMPTIDLLVSDDRNPRSLVFSLHQVAEDVRSLSDPQQIGMGDDERLAVSLHHAVQMAEPQVLDRVDDGGTRRSLERVLDLLDRDLPQLSDAITARYLIHTVTTRQLTDSRRGEIEATREGGE